MSNGRVLIDTIRSELDSNAGLKLSAKTDGFLLLKAKDIQFPLWKNHKGKLYCKRLQYLRKEKLTFSGTVLAEGK